MNGLSDLCPQDFKVYLRTPAGGVEFKSGHDYHTFHELQLHLAFRSGKLSSGYQYVASDLHPTDRNAVIIVGERAEEVLPSGSEDRVGHGFSHNRSEYGEYSFSRR